MKIVVSLCLAVAFAATSVGAGSAASIPIPAQTKCHDKWIDAAYAAEHMSLSGSQSSGDCNPDRYAAATWGDDLRGPLPNDDAKFARLKALVAASKLCGDPWVGEAYMVDGPKRSPSQAECNVHNYGSWGSGLAGYRELVGKVTKFVAQENEAKPITPARPPNETVAALTCEGKGAPASRLLVIVYGTQTCDLDIDMLTKATLSADEKTLSLTGTGRQPSLVLQTEYVKSATFNGTSYTHAQMVQALTQYFAFKGAGAASNRDQFGCTPQDMPVVLFPGNEAIPWKAPGSVGAPNMARALRDPKDSSKPWVVCMSQLPKGFNLQVF